MTANDKGIKQISIRLIQSVGEWKKIETIWESLWETTPNTSVLSSYRFLYSWYTYQNKYLTKPYILLLSDGSGKPIGLAPLFKIYHFLYGIPLRTITFMTDPIHCDRPNFLFPTLVEDQIKALFNFLYDCRKDWDQLLFQEQLLSETYTDAFNAKFIDQVQFGCDIIESSVAPYLSMTGTIHSWDSYLAERSKGHRKKWRNYQNRLKRIGQIQITRHTDCEGIASAIEEYKELELRSSKRRYLRLRKSHIILYKELIKDIESAGKIHITFLRIDNVPIAAIIGYEYKKKYAAIHTVFDKAYSAYSPGFLVGGFDIQWAIERRLKEYDFMGNFPSDKLRWTDSFHNTSRCRVIHKKRFGYLYFTLKFKINAKIMHIVNTNRLLLKLKYMIKKPEIKINESKFDKHNMIIKSDS
jgi:hypothetical protein